jgi:hypothetical protein
MAVETSVIDPSYGNVPFPHSSTVAAKKEAAEAASESPIQGTEGL